MDKRLKYRSYKHFSIFLFWVILFSYTHYTILAEPNAATIELAKWNSVILIIFIIFRIGFQITHDKICGLNLSESTLEWYLLSTSFPTPWTHKKIKDKYTDEMIYNNVNQIKQSLSNNIYYTFYFMNLDVTVTHAFRRYQINHL